jgi:hypothetical protein
MKTPGTEMFPVPGVSPNEPIVLELKYLLEDREPAREIVA